MKKSLAIFLISFSIFASFLRLPKSVQAQSVGLSISPPVVEILLSPNKKVTQTFTVTNQGENANITATLHAITPIDNVGHVSVSPTPLNPSDIPLIATLSPMNLGDSIAAAAGSSIPLTLTLEGVNVDAPVDAYFALVIEASPTSNAYHLTTTKPGISALIFVTLTPTASIPANLEITNFDPPFLNDSSLPFTINPILKNNAEIMLRPGGDYTILDDSGKTVFHMGIYKNLLLKNSSRLVQGNTVDKPDLVKSLTWNPGWKDLGPHRLRLTIVTEGGTKLTQVEKVVWFLPLRAIIAGILLAIIFGVVIINQRKRSRMDKTTT